ncbi:MAG: 4'-phosphopantetheinyl transferase superfamily protein [Planctomycetota bacterium]|nr:4'-phosphopantetheinyl transferase superfamily protein [Planctomycetota bacterium]
MEPAKMVPMDVLVLMERFEAPEPISTRELATAKSQAASRLLTRAMEQLGLQPWIPEKDSRGKPQPRDGWHVSKSHCEDCVAVALARVPLGVDVEPIRLARVAGWDRVIDDTERGFLGSVDALTFTRLWTAKEAALKISGQGIAELSQCRVMAPIESDCLRLRHGELERQAVQHITKDHVISVCSPGSDRISWLWLPESG